MQKASISEMYNLKTTGIPYSNSKYNLMVMDNIYRKINCLQQEAVTIVSAEITHKLHKGLNNIFRGIGCFDGTFWLQTKPESKPYQAPKGAYHTLQNPFKEELEWLQQQDIITALDVDKMVEWYNSSVLVPKPRGKVSYA